MARGFGDPCDVALDHLAQALVGQIVLPAVSSSIRAIPLRMCSSRLRK
jgi:hypothetical protein